MTSFVFITDIHLTDSAPYRTGSPLEDVLAKIRFVVNYANEANARILIGGDIYHSAVVPYEVSTAAALEFKKAKYRPLVIKGNHDQMYRNDAYDRKTALYAAIQLGVFDELTQALDFGTCVLSPFKTPVTDTRPCIVMYHGFLNIKDGKYTVTSDELREFPTQTFALLGHDHSESEPVVLGNTTVYRIGSLFRNQRIAQNDRQPKLLHIVSSEAGLAANLVTVPARPVSEIFREMEGKSDPAESTQELDYSSLIGELKSVSQEEVTLEQVISSVAPTDIAEYLFGLLSQAKLKQTK